MTEMMFLKIKIPLSMSIISDIPSNWKNIIKQNNIINMFTAAQHHFIWNSRVVTFQKVTSKELYWILTKTIEQKPTLQKYFEKALTDLSLDWEEMYMTPHFVSSNTYMKCFQYKVLNWIVHFLQIRNQTFYI